MCIPIPSLANHWRALVAVFVTLNLTATAVIGASFDCSKSRSYREQTVCSTPELSELDDTLDNVYQDARKSTSSPDLLKRLQRAWLTSADACDTATCLERAYRMRINQLRSTLASDADSGEPEAGRAETATVAASSSANAYSTATATNEAISSPNETDAIANPSIIANRSVQPSHAVPEAKKIPQAYTASGASPPEGTANSSIADNPGGRDWAVWQKSFDVAALLIAVAVLMPIGIKRFRGKKGGESSEALEPREVIPRPTNDQRAAPLEISRPKHLSSSAPRTSMLLPNELMEIARRSWNGALFRSVTSATLKSRPIMVFHQPVVGYSEQSVSVDSVRSRITSLLSELTPFSFLIEAGGETAVFVWLAIGDDMWSWGDRSAPRGAPLATSIEKAVALYKDESSGDADSKQIYMLSLFVLSDTDQTDINLASVEDAVPCMDGTALFFDAADNRVICQTWADGDRDSGYLDAEEDGYDTESYILDPSTARAYVVDVVSKLGNME